MSQIRKRRFSSFNLREALAVVGIKQLQEWTLNVPSVQPSAYFEQTIQKLKTHFDLSLSESAKSLLIDAFLLEALDCFDELKVWKEASLATDTLTGAVDYLVAPQGTVYQTPLLCVVEAKKDDFEHGLAQCLVEMYACLWYNQAEQISTDVYGIVTNAVLWRFYKLTPEHFGFESPGYAETQVTTILGMLREIFGQCVQNLKRVSAGEK